jgi:HAD superfamily hydrolase (TIGR01509 family)
MPNIRAIFFDQDGVIIDTERDGHRVAFNRTFAEFGLNVEWGVEQYHQLLQIGGGKERMAHYFRQNPDKLAGRDLDRLVRQLHERKTAVFIEMIEQGQLPLRPGVHRLMAQARDAGLKLGICTTSNERAAHAITSKYLADIPFDVVLAGDVVKRKKPDPEIYTMASSRTGVPAQQCLVVEDSANGVRAARGAGMNVLATVNDYTRGEDVSAADLVVSTLGDPTGARAELLASTRPIALGGCVHLETLIRYFQT